MSTPCIYLLSGSPAETVAWLRLNRVDEWLYLRSLRDLRGRRILPENLIRVGEWENSPLAFSSGLEVACPDWRTSPIYDLDRQDFLTSAGVELRTRASEEWRRQGNRLHQRWVLCLGSGMALVYTQPSPIALRLTGYSIGSWGRVTVEVWVPTNWLCRTEAGRLVVKEFAIACNIVDYSATNYERHVTFTMELPIAISPPIEANGIITLTVRKPEQIPNVLRYSGIDRARFSEATPEAQRDMERLGINSRFDKAMPKAQRDMERLGINLKPCVDCRHYHGETYGGNFLCCAMHPQQPEGDDCADREVQ